MYRAIAEPACELGRTIQSAATLQNLLSRARIGPAKPEARLWESSTHSRLKDKTS
jgi:hypothetical protein